MSVKSCSGKVPAWRRLAEAVGPTASPGKEVRRARAVVPVGHGLMRDTRALLIDGIMDAAITQNPCNTAQGCPAVFDDLRAGRDAMVGIAAPRTEIILREDVPS